MSPTLLSEACQNSAKHVTITIVCVYLDYTTQQLAPATASLSVVLPVRPYRVVKDEISPSSGLTGPGQQADQYLPGDEVYHHVTTRGHHGSTVSLWQSAVTATEERNPVIIIVAPDTSPVH